MKKPNKKKVKVAVPEPNKKKRRFSYKQCPYCEILNDARLKLCTDCDSPLFEEKEPKPPKNHQEVDWKGLERGESVYIICTDVWLSKKGYPVYMGDSGEFKIIKLTQEGILAYSTYCGFAFFNMVWSGTIGESGIRRGVTKIYKRVRGRRGD